jgi:hypothetical protein
VLILLAAPASADLVLIQTESTQLVAGIRVEPHGNGTLIHLRPVLSRGGHAAAQPITQVIVQQVQMQVQQPRPHNRFRDYRRGPHSTHRRQHVRPAALPTRPVGVPAGPGRER